MGSGILKFSAAHIIHLLGCGLIDAEWPDLGSVCWPPSVKTFHGTKALHSLSLLSALGRGRMPHGLAFTKELDHAEGLQHVKSALLSCADATRSTDGDNFT